MDPQPVILKLVALLFFLGRKVPPGFECYRLRKQQFTAARISGGLVVLPLTSSGHALCWVGSQGHHVLLSQDTWRRSGTGHLGSEHSGHQSGSPLRGFSGKCIHFVCLCTRIWKTQYPPTATTRFLNRWGAGGGG